MDDDAHDAAAAAAAAGNDVPAAAASTAQSDVPAAAVRGPELGVALLLMAFAVLVIVDSVRVGIGWADDGPRAGYFPFYIGVILLAASGTIAVTTLLRWQQLSQPFVMREEFAGVWAVLWPSVAAVALMPLAGLYVASALLIAWFMRRHGRYGWAVTLLVSLGVVAVLFVVFERWFLVPLPKGPLEQGLGL